MHITSLGLHLTDQCNVRCLHCSYNCGPEAKGVMTFDDAKRYLHEVSDRSLELLCISGGEPCLYFDLVADIVREGRARGVLNIWVFTNAYWAVNRTETDRKLEYLRQAGMTKLCLSADGFHQPFIPIERVRCALDSARGLGLEIVLDSRFLGPPLDHNPTNEITWQLLEELGDLKDVEIWQGEPWYIGRAADTLLPSHVTQRPGITNGRCPGPWTGGTWKNPAGVDVDSYGEVTLCPGVSIGNAKHRPLSYILAKFDPYAHSISRDMLRGGPAVLAERARRIGYSSRPSYVSECHLCYDVRRFLRPRYTSELAPRICYEE